MLLPNQRTLSSAGHALGQYVGDWWERWVIFPVLQSVATKLDLFLDNRYVHRTCRAGKIHWRDVDGNDVDYDFALELGGTPSERGVPVGFIESFWRRGARHSKDKARDDTNKLLPMRETYPTARFLAIAACGEFTEPARGYVTSRNVELLYVPKGHIIECFRSVGIEIDYPDSMSEVEKAALVDKLYEISNEEKMRAASEALVNRTGELFFSGFAKRVEAALSALPAEIRFLEAWNSDVVSFSTVEAAEEFLQSPKFSYGSTEKCYTYQITYSDGYEFSRNELTWESLHELHVDLLSFVRHVQNVI